MINELREFKKEQAVLTGELEQLKFKKTEASDKMVRGALYTRSTLLNHTPL